MIAKKLKPVDEYMVDVGKSGWVYVLLGMIDTYHSEEDKTCLNEYNSFWNIIVGRVNEKGHNLSRDAFRKLIALEPK